MNKSLSFLCFSIVLGFAGCVTPQPQKIPTPLAGLSPLPVRCVWDRGEEMKNFPLMAPGFSTGEIFASVFNGTEAAQPLIEIVESRMAYKISDDDFITTFTYKATVAFTAEGNRQELKTAYSSDIQGFEMLSTATRVTIETAIADLYRQIKPLL